MHERTPKWFEFIFPWFARKLDKIERKLDHLHEHFLRNQMTQEEFAAQLQTAIDKATENNDELGSIKILVEGLKTSVGQLNQTVLDLQTQINNGQNVDLTALSAQVTTLQAKLDDTDAVADGILAGTDSDPNA